MEKRVTFLRVFKDTAWVVWLNPLWYAVLFLYTWAVIDQPEWTNWVKVTFVTSLPPALILLVAGRAYTDQEPEE